MKIIGMKDYYDYGLTYGVDSKVVLDRRNWEKFNLSNYTDLVPAVKNTTYLTPMRLYFCGKIHDFLFSNEGKFWWNEEMDEVGETYLRQFYYPQDHTRRSLELNKGFKLLSNQRSLHALYGENSAVNLDHQLPILLDRKPMDRRSSVPLIPIHNLADLKFARVIPAQDAFAQIYNFQLDILDKPPVKSDILTNEGKITSHGFDLKTSFRGKTK